jgi:hypothetical protein
MRRPWATGGCFCQIKINRKIEINKKENKLENYENKKNVYSNSSQLHLIFYNLIK